MSEIGYLRQLQEKYDVDVCVVGGGPAGIAAALAAIRQGASVFLAESQGYFGGAATAALVPAFMPFDNGVAFLAGGIGKEIYDLCIGSHFYLKGRTLGIHAEKFKKILDDMITESGVMYSFFTTMIDIVKDGDRVSHAVFAAKSGVFAVKAKVFIDATGDGDLCAWAGAPFELGDKNGIPMPSTLCSVWADIDWDAVKGPDNRMLEKAFEDGLFTQEDRHLSGMWRTWTTLGGGNIGHVFEVNATDEVSLTKAMITGRRIMPEYEKYYREYLAGGFKNAHVVITGSQLGVRESRRIMGDYVLNVDDFNNRACFDDEIGRFSYPVDIHIAKPTKEAYEAFHKEFTSMRYADGESYGIPYRALLPQNLPNVYVTGRCISTDKQMQSSVRVIPGCFITGQAAGVGAALAARQNETIRGIDVKQLQRRLIDMGAVFS